MIRPAPRRRATIAVSAGASLLALAGVLRPASAAVLPARTELTSAVTLPRVVSEASAR